MAPLVAAAPINGVEVAGQTPPPAAEGGGTILPPPAGATLINFDDVVAPSLFSDTQALRDEYIEVGVVFEGPGPQDGGALLDGSSFTVSGLSVPNILAFNVGASYPDGGIPAGPERLLFQFPVSHVQINAGTSNTVGDVSLECFDDGGISVGSDSFAGGAALSTLVVSGAGIVECVVAFTATVGVFDDLAFVPVPTPPVIDVPALSGVGGLILVLVLMAAALHFFRSRA